MLPVQDTNHVTEGLALRTGKYLAKANIQAALTAFLNRIQDAEDMLFDVIESQLTTRTFVVVAGNPQGSLNGPPDQALLQLADLVGCPVGTLTTAQLAFLLGIWRLARRSQGLTEDLLGILAAAFPPVGGVEQFTLEEFPLLEYQATVYSLPVGDEPLLAPLAQALTMARPPCVGAVLAWGAWPTETFFFGDGSPGGAPGSGLGDGSGVTTYPALAPAGLLSGIAV